MPRTHLEVGVLDGTTYWEDSWFLTESETGPRCSVFWSGLLLDWMICVYLCCVHPHRTITLTDNLHITIHNSTPKNDCINLARKSWPKGSLHSKMLDMVDQLITRLLSTSNPKTSSKQEFGWRSSNYGSLDPERSDHTSLGLEISNQGNLNLRANGKNTGS